jgi:hypothetical protein
MSAPPISLAVSVIDAADGFDLKECVSRAELSTPDAEVDMSDLSEGDETDQNKNEVSATSAGKLYNNSPQVSPSGSGSTVFSPSLGPERQLTAKDRRKQKAREKRRVEREKERQRRGTSDKGIVLRHKSRLHASRDRIEGRVHVLEMVKKGTSGWTNGEREAKDERVYSLGQLMGNPFNMRYVEWDGQ